MVCTGRLGRGKKTKIIILVWRRARGQFRSFLECAHINHLEFIFIATLHHGRAVQVTINCYLIGNIRD